MTIFKKKTAKGTNEKLNVAQTKKKEHNSSCTVYINY